MMELLVVAVFIFIMIVSISLGFNIYKEIEEYLNMKKLNKEYRESIKDYE